MSGFFVCRVFLISKALLYMQGCTFHDGTISDKAHTVNLANKEFYWQRENFMIIIVYCRGFISKEWQKHMHWNDSLL